MRFRVFGFLKQWFGKPAEHEPEHAAPDPEPEAAPPPPEPTPRPQVRARVAQSTTEVRLPFALILRHMPADLRRRTSVTAAQEVEISIPVADVLPQLASGAVRISFGQLRQIAPKGMFTDAADSDAVLIQLPLAEIITRIHPSLLTRRNTQRVAEVPDEISGPFANGVQGISIGDAEEARPVARPRFVAPVPKPATPLRSSVPSVPPISMPKAAPELDAIPLPFQKRQISFNDPNSVPVQLPNAIQPSHSENGNGNGHGNGNGVLPITLSEVASNWPESIRQEIAQMSLFRSSILFPLSALENSLKNGKVAFTWRQLRAWIQPPAPETVSINDPAVLELPLKLVAPLFLAKKQTLNRQKRLVADEAIPNLFYNGVTADSSEAISLTPSDPTVEAKKTEDTNYYVWGEVADTPVDAEATFKRGTATPNTAFLKRYATPNEIVSKASTLDGVVGALIALPDGLLVASRVPTDLNAETLAAFLPHIFGKVSACTKELRMGELNNLNFTVGNIPWKIFRVGSIFFAAFGRSGEGLPTAQLTKLAAELDRNPKT